MRKKMHHAFLLLTAKFYSDLLAQKHPQPQEATAVQQSAW